LDLKKMSAHIPFDLVELAPNGLRRGLTTGTCATGAVKAALTHLLFGETIFRAKVTLADGEHFVEVPVARVFPDGDSIRADVVKDAGDDPDQTHRAIIFARVKRNDAGGIVFKNGRGVGIATQPGLQIPVGEPAINPTPREMMRRAVREILDECGDAENSLRAGSGFDLEIGCENGEEIARRTFNPRLGVRGGISILGTTGIVEPKSMASFKASIEVYIRVALGDQPAEIVLAPGNLGQKFSRASLGLPIKQVVQMSNFVGFAFACMNRTLAENDFVLPKLWIVGHPGKLAKLLNGVEDTHSGESASAVAVICRIAREFWQDETLAAELEKSKTVEGIIQVLHREFTTDPNGAEKNKLRAFWEEIEKRIARIAASKLNRVHEVQVRLFQMDGTALGGQR
jgi:cobalt-precorrin-5B (C1)-methyltransferase